MKRIDWKEKKEEILFSSDDNLRNTKYNGIIIVDQESPCHVDLPNHPGYNCFRPSYPVADIL